MARPHPWPSHPWPPHPWPPHPWPAASHGPFASQPPDPMAASHPARSSHGRPSLPAASMAAASRRPHPMALAPASMAAASMARFVLAAVPWPASSHGPPHPWPPHPWPLASHGPRIPTPRIPAASHPMALRIHGRRILAAAPWLSHPWPASHPWPPASWPSIPARSHPMARFASMARCIPSSLRPMARSHPARRIPWPASSHSLASTHGPPLAARIHGRFASYGPLRTYGPRSHPGPLSRIRGPVLHPGPLCIPWPLRIPGPLRIPWPARIPAAASCPPLMAFLASHGPWHPWPPIHGPLVLARCIQARPHPMAAFASTARSPSRSHPMARRIPWPLLRPWPAHPMARPSRRSHPMARFASHGRPRPWPGILAARIPWPASSHGPPHPMARFVPWGPVPWPAKSTARRIHGRRPCGFRSCPTSGASLLSSAVLSLRSRPTWRRSAGPQRCLFYAVPAQIRQFPPSISSLCDVLHANLCAAGGRASFPTCMPMPRRGSPIRGRGGPRPQPSFLRTEAPTVTLELPRKSYSSSQTMRVEASALFCSYHVRAGLAGRGGAAHRRDHTLPPQRALLR